MRNPAPDFVAYGSGGQSIPGQFSVPFQHWCSANGADPRKTAAAEMQAMEDVMILADTRDPRANELLTRDAY